jgi:hypothetical protein
MPKQVNGFLAEDGTFFENEPECKRYEHMKFLESLCETHELNYENFIAVINAWHQQIKGYFDADDACQVKQTKQDHTLDFTPKYGDFTDDNEPLLPTEGDHSYSASGDKNAPGFLEQSLRRNF